MDGIMRVLVVEDVPNFLEPSIAFLRNAGYSIDAVMDAQQGLSKGLTLEYDAIILDVAFPESDGWSILRELRHKNKLTPVLMLTTSNLVTDRIKGLDWGADDCLVRPFAIPELEARIRALVRRSAGSPQALIDIGLLSMNITSRRVAFKGNEVPLTAKEYCLLELLVIHRNKLVTRDMIYEHMFDVYDLSLSNLVDVYVSKIRRKIGHPVITTVRGKGYIIKG
jgi:two-component system OmpR family response regulator